MNRRTQLSAPVGSAEKLRTESPGLNRCSAKLKWKGWSWTTSIMAAAARKVGELPAVAWGWVPVEGPKYVVVFVVEG